VVLGGDRVVAMAHRRYIGWMAANNQSGSGRKRSGTTGGHYRSAKTGRFVSASVAEKTGKSVKTPAMATASPKSRSVGKPTMVAERVVAMPRAKPIVRSYSEAEEEAVVRIARKAEAARRDPGKNLSGLSDEEFLARLLS
jgi:hypothetical protein